MVPRKMPTVRRVEYFTNPDGAKCKACEDVIHSTWWRGGLTGNDYSGGGEKRFDGTCITGGGNKHKKLRKQGTWKCWYPKAEVGQEAWAAMPRVTLSQESVLVLRPGSWSQQLQLQLQKKNLWSPQVQQQLTLGLSSPQLQLQASGLGTAGLNAADGNAAGFGASSPPPPSLPQTPLPSFIAVAPPTDAPLAAHLTSGAHPATLALTALPAAAAATPTFAASPITAGPPGLSAGDSNAASIGATAGASSSLTPLSLPPQAPPPVAPGVENPSPSPLSERDILSLLEELSEPSGCEGGSMSRVDAVSELAAASNAGASVFAAGASTSASTPCAGASGAAGASAAAGAASAAASTAAAASGAAAVGVSTAGGGEGGGEGGGGEGGGEGGGGEGALAPTNPAAPSDAGTEGTVVLAVPPTATVTVAEGHFMERLLKWTGDYDLQTSVAEAMQEIGWVAHKHVRRLLTMDDAALRKKFKGLREAAMDELTELVKAAQDKAAKRRDPVECFIEEVLRMGVNDSRAAEKKLLEKHRETLKVEEAHKIGFTIKLDGDIEKEQDDLRERLEKALIVLLPDAEVRSLKRGCILVTCEWLSGGAWELPAAVRQTLSDPNFKLAGFPLLFEDGAPSLKIEYFKVQLRASDVCLQLLG